MKPYYNPDENFSPFREEIFTGEERNDRIQFANKLGALINKYLESGECLPSSKIYLFKFPGYSQFFPPIYCPEYNDEELEQLAKHIAKEMYEQFLLHSKCNRLVLPELRTGLTEEQLKSFEDDNEV